jgi:hypothetical protein
VELGGTLRRHVPNETVAEDLLSDVFLDVWRQAASFEGRASVSTWLLAIALLRGARPADLPFEQPTHFRLIINKKTLEMLGSPF